MILAPCASALDGSKAMRWRYSRLIKDETMPLHFELVTPARLVRSEDVHMVVVPGTEGEFGVLEGHAPFMSTIRDGAVQVYRTAGAAPESIEVRGGFAEVRENGLTVLAEHVEG
jgi:F-type H+-transporting ATPase subunit epsilon